MTLHREIPLIGYPSPSKDDDVDFRIVGKRVVFYRREPPSYSSVIVSPSGFGGKRTIATLDVSVGAAISNVDQFNQFIFASRARLMLFTSYICARPLLSTNIKSNKESPVVRAPPQGLRCRVDCK